MARNRHHFPGCFVLRRRDGFRTGRLEDAPGSSFAGKYESHFCPNQGTPEENLHNLTQAIQRIYASIFNPDALLYRRAKGLQDYDERMAALPGMGT